MDDDALVSKLLELIFVKKFEIGTETTNVDSSIPACLLTDDFYLKLRHVFLVKQACDHEKWNDLFDTEKFKPVTNFEEYAIAALFVSIGLHVREVNIFDSFITICAFVRYYAHETLLRRGLNFKHISCDIVLELYESKMKATFCRRGGFLRLMEYIRRHKYHRINLDPAYLDDPSVKVSAETAKKLEKESILTSKNWISAYHKEYSMEDMNELSVSLATRIFVRISTNKTSDHELNRNVDETENNKKPETFQGKPSIQTTLKCTNLEELSPGCSKSNTDSKTKESAKKKASIARYNNIIEAVIKYNRSKPSRLTKTEHHIQKEVEETFQRIKNSIQTLIQILDE